MPDLPDLLILRHGETEWNREGRMQGVLDSALTAEGEAQARAQGEILARHGVEGFDWLSSPQGRALRTAEIARAAPVATDPRLREIGMGGWTGLLRDEIAVRHPEFFGPEAAPLAYYGHAPEGETLDALAGRLRALLAALERPTVLVTHGVTSRMLRCLALDLPIGAFAHLEGGQGVVYRIAGGTYERLEREGVVAQSLPQDGV